jgi:MFS family permease
MRADHWPVVLVVAYAVYMDYFIYGLIVPLTPYSAAGALNAGNMALLYGSYAAGVLLDTPLFGYLGDRFGCRTSVADREKNARSFSTKGSTAVNFAIPQ